MKKRTTPSQRRRKAYSYSRFSTPEQGKGDSLRRQTAMAADYAARHNLDLDDDLTFRDLGVSAYRGKNAATGKLGEFVAAVEHGRVEQGAVLLVENLDRVSRQAPLDAIMLLNKIVSSGVSVVTLTDSREYTQDTLRRDPMTLMIAVMTAIRANEESERKAQRLRESWIGKKAKAKKEIITAMAPCWLKPNADRTGWDEDKAKVKVVKRIFDLTQQGVGVNKIAMTLNAEGVPAIGRTRRRRADAPGAGAPGKWQVTFIQKLLANPAVIGEFHDHRREYNHDSGKYTRTSTGEVIKGYFPRIIDTAIFRKIGVQLSSRRNKTKPRNGKVTNLFAGLCRCPRCAGTMTSVNKGNGAKVSLVCAKAKIGAGCHYHAVRLHDVETAFLDAADDLSRHVPTGNGKLDAELRRTEAEVEECANSLDAEQELYRKQPSQFLAKYIREGERLLEALTTRLRLLGAVAESANNKVLDARARELAAALPSPFGITAKDGTETPAPANKEAINAILHRIFDHVVIDYDRGNLVINWRNAAKTRIKYGKPLKRDKAAA
jgi:DNA invertase Pin-like site-specific DNA recombinase